jgi:hypothetical protein
MWAFSVPWYDFIWPQTQKQGEQAYQANLNRRQRALSTYKSDSWRPFGSIRNQSRHMRQVETVKTMLDELIRLLNDLAKTREDQVLIATTLEALDDKYDLSRKISQAPGLKEIIQQLMGRIYRAYGDFARPRGKRILDIASGSNTSKAPSSVFVNTPFGEQRIMPSSSAGYSALFEPWFCRILLELGADPVGIDLGNLDQETFEHYQVDLGQPGALDFLPDHSFDAIQDSRLFGSPEFTAQLPDQADRLNAAAEIWKQEQRLLKANGIVIHSDATNLLGENRMQ